MCVRGSRTSTSVRSLDLERHCRKIVPRLNVKRERMTLHCYFQSKPPRAHSLRVIIIVAYVRILPTMRFREARDFSSFRYRWALHQRVTSISEMDSDTKFMFKGTVGGRRGGDGDGDVDGPSRGNVTSKMKKKELPRRANEEILLQAPARPRCPGAAQDADKGVGRLVTSSCIPARASPR